MTATVGTRRRESVDEKLDRLIEEKLMGRFGHILDDISWRLRHFTDLADKISAEQLNLNTHLLTGYTVTNNHNGTAATPGSIYWADLHIVYQGTDYTVTNGTTANKFVWWALATPTALQSAATKPTLTTGDVLVFVNESGTAHVVPGNTMAHGAAVAGRTIGNESIATGAVTAASGILSTSDKPVTDTVVATGAITAANGGLSTTSKPVTNAVVATGAITATNGGLSTTDKPVTSGVVASGAITNTNGGLSTTDAPVATATVRPGAISTTKLNVLQHMIF